LALISAHLQDFSKAKDGFEKTEEAPEHGLKGYPSGQPALTA